MPEAEFFQINAVSDDFFALHRLSDGNILQITSNGVVPWDDEMESKLKAFCSSLECFSALADFLLSLNNIRVSVYKTRKLSQSDEVYFLSKRQTMVLNKKIEIPVNLIMEEEGFFSAMELVSEIFELPIMELSGMRCQF